jgi:hypothetical protein
MATTQEAIARLRMIFETQGADQAVAEMKKLETAETSLGTSSLNLDRSFANLERRYSETARAAAEYERSMKTLNAAVAQNPALAGRAAAVEQTIAARYQATMQAAHQAAQAQTLYGQASERVFATTSMLAGSTGFLGTALGTISKGGLAVATGIGAAGLAFHTLNESATGIANYARDIKHFSEATGLSTTQVQGLTKEASKFGIEGESVRRSVLRFTASFEEMRSGSGSLYESIRNVDGGLAEQMRSSETATDALQMMVRAINAADTAWQKARLTGAAFGKEARGQVSFYSQLDFANMTGGRRGLSEDLINELDKMQIAVNQAAREMQLAWSRGWATTFLEFKRQMYETGTDLLNMPAAVKAQVIQSTTRASDEDALKVFDEQEQILKKRLEEIEAAAAAMGDTTSQQFLKLVADAERLKRQLEEVREEQAKIARPEAALGAAATGAAGSVAPPTLAQMKTDDIVAASNRYKELQSVLGGLVPVAQQVEEAFRQIELAMRRAPTEEYKQQIEAAKDELIAFKTVQAELSQVAPGTYQRQAEAIKELKAQYPGLVAQDANRMALLDAQLQAAQAVTSVERMDAQEQVRMLQLKGEGYSLELRTAIAGKERAIGEAQVNSNALQTLASLRDQYGVAAAVGGVEKMRAQYAATYNSLVRQGVSSNTASAVAGQEMANTQAQINAGASQTLFNLQNQYDVAKAVTGAEKIRAQEAATYNSLVQQGVNAGLAAMIAAQERANAEAEVNANISRQVIALDESTELIYAQLRGTEAKVKAEQAYNRALRDGGDLEHAAALAAATYNNEIARRMAQQQPEPDPQAMEAQRQGLLSGAGQVVQEIESAAQAGSQLARTLLGQLRGESGAAVLASPDLLEMMQKIQQEVALAPKLQQYQQAQEQAQEQLRSLQDQYRLGGAATDQEKAQIQWQITYEKLIRDGVASNLAKQIADQELANTMQDLAKAVDENTSALQAQLDPIYTEGRAALRIGYYGEGSGGTMRTVTGTGFGTPANMNAPAAPALAAPAPVVVINNNFPTGAVMGDRTTQYQAANSYGRAIKAMI